MKKIFLILALFVGMLRAEEGIVRAVFDLTTADAKTFESRLLKGVAFHKAHYEGKFKELEIVVVIHGGAYKFFVKEIGKTAIKIDAKEAAVLHELKQRIESLVKTYNVKLQMCGIGMKKYEIKEENIYEFVEVVPSAMVGLIDAQSSGHSYIPIF